MSDRAIDIRARLNRAVRLDRVPEGWGADIGWLLDEVERLRGLAACLNCGSATGGDDCRYCGQEASA